MENLFLPHCWVCERRFVNAVPPGNEQEERHHIIPRKAGGEDGPQVSLCLDHHTKLHKIATRLSSKRSYFEFLRGESPDRQKKLLWLPSQVHNAFELTRDDPNKSVSVLFVLGQEHKRMIDKLRPIYPQLKSREALLSFA